MGPDDRVPNSQGIDGVYPELFMPIGGAAGQILKSGVSQVAMRGVIVSQVSESVWMKAVNPASNSLMQAWGRLTIKAQEAALVRLRAAGSPAANSVMLDRSTLLTENVGVGSNRLSSAYFSAWMRDSRALGTPFNDLVRRNYGAGFRAFDPVHDPVSLGVLKYGTIGSTGAAASYVCSQGGLGCN